MDEFKEQLRAKKLAEKSANEVNLLNMIESRISEIIETEREIKRKVPRLFSQRLPRFMRRRAACHDVKRLTKKLRHHVKVAPKKRDKLMLYRRRKQFLKHKRILRKHSHLNYKDEKKCLLHRWFAKRFRMDTSNTPNKHIPLHNNTKNQRNLYRQTLYGCAHLSMAHLVGVKLEMKPTNQSHVAQHLENLNKLADVVSGFTFCAEALELGQFEVVVKLFKAGEFLCNALVFLDNYSRYKEPSHMTLWVPRAKQLEVYDAIAEVSKHINENPLKYQLMLPKESTRVRLIGPDARKRALSLAKNPSDHQHACDYVDTRCHESLGLAIGRCIVEDAADFIYYRTHPYTVDIVFKNAAGRFLWCNLVKNKAHLVGGHRDWDVLSKTLPFCLE